MTEPAHITRIENKIDKMAEDITDIKVTIARNTGSLEEHIKRTNILERQVRPVYISYKVLGLLVASTFVIAAVTEILGYLKK